MDGIVLCGGESKRMKPYLPFSKALVEIRKGQTLLEYQFNWLRKNGLEHVILAIDEQTHNKLNEEKPHFLEEVDCSLEKERLGTGGAVSKAAKLLRGSPFYLMNVDDIILSDSYRPQKLLELLETYEGSMGSILLGRTSFPFGVVETSSSQVNGFLQKPTLDYKVCTGHYAFTKEGVERYFPLRGSFEDTSLPLMVRDGSLYSMELKGEWITVNNLKQLEAARKRMK